MVLLCFLSVFVSLLAAMLVVRRVRGHAGRYGYAKPQRFHVGDVPRLGGVAIFMGLLCGWCAAVVAFRFDNTGLLNISAPVVWAWGAVLLPALIGGVAEDLTQRLPVRYRLLLTGLSAALALALMEVAVMRLGLPHLDSLLAAAPWFGLALAFLAVTGLPHAFNIIDGYNGLAGMVALVASLALIYGALQVGDRQLAGMLLCLVGATAGFLVWNYPRGMLFAGDGGAYLWGVTIAVASLVLVQRHEQVSPWFPLLLLIYPVWETLFSIYRKLMRGTSPSVADALHFHQLIYRRIVHGVFHDDESRRVLTLLFWRNTPVLMGFCGLFVLSYVAAYMTIIRFKVPRWLRR
jgi:UDP-GlcNAc:undecaprenyl-phosphate/decaprenyl-phosphate GlcNAc-1-phosphate transferase